MLTVVKNGHAQHALGITLHHRVAACSKGMRSTKRGMLLTPARARSTHGHHMHNCSAAHDHSQQ